MVQIVQILGAITILTAFAGSQVRLLQPYSYRYIILNLFGSCVLAVAAYLEEQWGFLMLNTAWSLVSAWSLYVRSRGLPSSGRKDADPT
jgi:hypothetical protein